MVRMLGRTDPSDEVGWSSMDIGGETSPWPAEVMCPARPKCGSQGPASERPPEAALKESAATNTPAWRNLPAA
eukprot:14928990-Alexandrium_andersonii.AAC.1